MKNENLPRPTKRLPSLVVQPDQIAPPPPRREQPPTSAQRNESGLTTVYVPEASWERYHGYLADMYQQVDEARRYKAKWYSERERWIARVAEVRSPNGSRSDHEYQWGKCPESGNLAGMEQWCQRQVLMYAAAAERELARLTGAERGHVAASGS